MCANQATFTDRHGLIVPKDGQDQPADNDVAVQKLTNASDYNWGDAIQENLLEPIDDGLVGVGTLGSRPGAGSSAPRVWAVTDGGVSSDDVPYLTYNNGSQWLTFQRVSSRSSVTSGFSTSYNASAGESIWVQADTAAVDVNLFSPRDFDHVRVVVTDATNDVTLVRNGSEDIDGVANDLVIRTERVVELESNGTDWRTVQETQGTFATGSATLSSGSASVDTGVATSTDSDYFLDVSLRPENGADIAASLEDDSGGTGNWLLHLEENTTSVGNPTVGWKLYPV